MYLVPKSQLPALLSQTHASRVQVISLGRVPGLREVLEMFFILYCEIREPIEQLAEDFTQWRTMAVAAFCQL